MKRCKMFAQDTERLALLYELACAFAARIELD
jgi:hypothetical protein